MPTEKSINRRSFLKQSTAAVGAVALPYFVPASALGQAKRAAASNRIVLGCIGTGKQSKHLIRAFMNEKDTQFVSVCDVDKLKLNYAKETIEKRYADQMQKGTYKGCESTGDFRAVLAREDLDAVIIATPDHWHAIPVIQAVKQGFDIYCEKPLSLTIHEARQMVNAVRRYNRVFQTGSMQRSDGKFRFACEIVRNGYIGKIQHVIVNVGGPPVECRLPAEPTPDYLDWNRWLGPAPMRPYHSELSPHISRDIFPNWRNYRDYAGGGMTDWGAHHFDIAQWGLGMDDTGPVDIIPPDGKEYQALTYKYANGITMSREDKANGVLFIGDKGKVEVNRGHLKTWPENLAQQKLKPNEVHLYNSPNHYGDFLQAIRKRSRPICDVEIGCRTVTVCHLGNLAYELKRPLKWDPAKEEFLNDPEANRLRSRPKRSPWNI